MTTGQWVCFPCVSHVLSFVLLLVANVRFFRPLYSILFVYNLQARSASFGPPMAIRLVALSQSFLPIFSPTLSSLILSQSITITLYHTQTLSHSLSLSCCSSRCLCLVGPSLHPFPPPSVSLLPYPLHPFLALDTPPASILDALLGPSFKDNGSLPCVQVQFASRI
ncbi:MAG: hypothetical protein J3Q66DRAFT_357255 [Benniella sp.]|nr:MAG: hypothetical protein J3Q66DRAFT_357255 [Benniella sp.]